MCAQATRAPRGKAHTDSQGHSGVFVALNPATIACHGASIASSPERPRTRSFAGRITMALFSVRALGFPEIRRDDRLCQLALRKGFALLIYLAEAKRAVGRDAVATMLWPESSEDVVRARGGLEPRSTKPGGQRSRLDHQVTGDLLPADGDTASEVTNFVCTWRLCCTRACTFAMMRSPSAYGRHSHIAAGLVEGGKFTVVS